LRTTTARLEQELGGPGSLAGRCIGLLGLAFKANTDDVRESPALAIAATLRAAGAAVLGHDPRAEGRARLADPELDVAATAVEAAEGADAIVIATEWPEYGQLDWTAVAAVMHGTVVYDTRAVVDVEAAQAAGLHVIRLGRPGSDGGPKRPIPQPAAVASRRAAPAPSRASES